MRDKARPGDLLFYKVTPQSWWLSKLIAIVQILRSEGEREIQYSHVSIVSTDTNKQIEAFWPRVRESEIDWDLYNLELCRINNIDYKQASNMVLAAVERIGDMYDLGQFFFGVLPSKQKQICTSLVVESAGDVGFSLAESSGRLITPNELRDDPQVRRVI